MIDRSDIQGLVFGSYGRMPFSCALLVEFDVGDAASWLARIIPDVSSALRAEAHAEVASNVAFSFAGLERLGLPAATLAELGPEFSQGMVHPDRSLALGDAGEDAPAHWEFRDGPGGVDAVVLVYARTAERLEERLDVLDAGFERFGLRARELPMYLPADGREHFGFRMGVSEPSIAGRRRRGEGRVPLGEVLLGYRNGFGDLARVPIAPRLRSTREPPRLVDGANAVAWGLNGSYLVLRKLEQRVATFWRFAERAAQETAASNVELAAARLVGRWPNGAPLACYPEAPPGEPFVVRRFSYQELDPKGRRCPFGAHVRRAHPGDMRGDKRHRLLRRGRLYGPRLEDPATDDGVERGLVFLALNADLGRQFETVQANLLASPPGTALRNEPEALIGAGANGLPRRFTIPAEPVRRVLVDVPRFVRVRGGGYFFLPSVSALGYLADLRHALGRALRPSS